MFMFIIITKPNNLILVLRLVQAVKLKVHDRYQVFYLLKENVNLPKEAFSIHMI